MIELNKDCRFFFYREPIHMANGHKGLYELITKQFPNEEHANTYFIFLNENRERMKVFYEDRFGSMIWYKKLNHGSFEISHLFKNKIDKKTFLRLIQDNSLDAY